MDKDSMEFEPEKDEEQTNDLEENNLENENNTEVPAETETEEAEKPFDYKREILEWIFALALAFIIALGIKEYVFTMVKVEGHSMVPTLQDEDRLGVWRLGYQPHKGDVIILHPRSNPKTAYVKRIIALPGQTVTINFSNHKVLTDGKVLEANQVYVDGQALDEPYINEKTARNENMKFPVDSIKVEPNTVFVMGDNRNNSSDSRSSSVGLVDYKSVMGKAIFRLWPFDRFGAIDKETIK